MMAKITTYEVQNSGTRYLATTAQIGGEVYIMVVTRSSLNAGEWIRLDAQDESIAWSYLTEKMPGLTKFGGDKEGFVKLFAKIGIRVFG